MCVMSMTIHGKNALSGVSMLTIQLLLILCLVSLTSASHVGSSRTPHAVTPADSDMVNVTLIPDLSKHLYRRQKRARLNLAAPAVMNK